MGEAGSGEVARGDDAAGAAWTRRPDLDRVAALLAAARSGARDGRLDLGDERSVVFHDVGLQAHRFDELTAAFPSGALHAVAVKANPLVEVLRPLVASGAGCETASLEEVYLAQAAGCPPERIVFDSPAKTESELRFALDRGITINVDNVEELDRIERLGVAGDSIVGIRVNPAVGDGAIGLTSVGGRGSRFGMPLDDAVAAVLDRADRLPQLRGLHVHVGSQGCTLEQLVAGAQAAQRVRDEVAATRPDIRLDHVDIGGGLPTDYGREPTAPNIAEYVGALRRAVPELFADDVRLVTEMGRALFAGCGVAVTRVEYTKQVDGVDHAVVHLGADMLLRTAYHPDSWPYRFSLVDADGVPKASGDRRWTIAGPLCFAGDIIGREVAIGDAEPGDHLVIHDVGAYTYSMWSRHCSRGMPPVVGHVDGTDLRQLRTPETPEDIARFWGVER